MKILSNKEFKRLKEIEKNLFETSAKHRDMVDAFAYMFASKYAKLKDDYFFLYIKKKPKFMPSFIYKWFIKKKYNTRKLENVNLHGESISLKTKSREDDTERFITRLSKEY